MLRWSSFSFLCEKGQHRRGWDSSRAEGASTTSAGDLNTLPPAMFVTPDCGGKKDWTQWGGWVSKLKSMTNCFNEWITWKGPGKVWRRTKTRISCKKTNGQSQNDSVGRWEIQNIRTNFYTLGEQVSSRHRTSLWGLFMRQGLYRQPDVTRMSQGSDHYGVAGVTSPQTQRWSLGFTRRSSSAIIYWNLFQGVCLRFQFQKPNV